MTHRIPSGTRDVLPDEMRELRAITGALLQTFADSGFGEVSTPAVEYEDTLRRGDMGDLPGYRVLDDHGEMLALRSDMTVPIARLVGTRYDADEGPLRFCYAAHSYRAVHPHRGQMREFLQAGVELIGAAGEDGTAEVLTVLCRSLEASGLKDFRIGLGDAGLFPALLAAHGVPEEQIGALLDLLTRRDMVGLEEHLAATGIEAEGRERLLAVAGRRGTADVLASGHAAAAGVLDGLRAVVAKVPIDVRQRIIIDLGMSRRLGYYTGAIFEIYDPALGEPIGSGGRYDDLMARFGRPRPAVGFAIGVDLLHAALAGEERGERMGGTS